MCQQLPARQALLNMLRASLELWRKSATLREPVARLHRMGEVLTTLRLFDKQVKPMSTETQQSLAAVHRRYIVYILTLGVEKLFGLDVLIYLCFDQLCFVLLTIGHFFKWLMIKMQKNNVLFFFLPGALSWWPKYSQNNIKRPLRNWWLYHFW